MKKNIFISIVVSCFFIFSALITFIIQAIGIKDLIALFVLGFSIMLASMLFGIIGRGSLIFGNILSLVLSSVSLSNFTYAWCIHSGVDATFWSLELNALLACAFIFLFYLITIKTKKKSTRIALCSLFTAVGIASVILFIVYAPLIKFSLFGLYLIPASTFLWALLYDRLKNKEYLSILSFLGFSVFVVGFIVLVKTANLDVDLEETHYINDPARDNMDGYNATLEDLGEKCLIQFHLQKM